MKTNRFIAIVVLTVAFVVTASAQKKPKFTSTYSSMGAGCKVLKGGEGQDDAKVCPGPAGYQIRISPAVAEVQITAERKGTDESTPVAVVGLDYDESKVKLEWRHANGKPFAIIIRMPKYELRQDGEPGPGKKVGEILLVSGIGDFEFITEEVNAKKPGANVKARAAADKAYSAN